ncbi:MAG: M20/M25/M40 family metallo-hydrolase [candidate division KSB1 bacterium]|nr:M20/M25/M40 family metallo-hydrolase [candidate division KSB1 bacterium]MDZ7302063.1 M20/M25/M40 family metallo-hydrolase [candidate division KSB1 bacterium]
MLKRTLLVGALALFWACSQHPRFPINHSSSPELSARDVQYHVNYLASDALEGRLAGTPGSEQAAGYIATEFKRYGLLPLGEKKSYEQVFDFVGDVSLGRNNRLTFQRGQHDTTLAIKTDFIPAGFSASDSISGEVAFVGYGIPAERQNYNDYADIDVSGKIVLALRYSPPATDPHRNFAQFEALRYKALQARQRGARALLVVVGSEDKQDSSAQAPAQLPKLRFDRSAADAGLPVIFITQKIADWLLAASGESIQTLQRKINQNQKPASFTIPGARATVITEIRQERRVTANIIGKLAGSDPKLKEQAIIIGAHYDHLGRSSEGAMDPEKEGEIRNGADDNASGTAGVLELAQYFAAQKKRPRRSLIFMAFSAEELGTLGSLHYVNQPTFPLEKTVAMINLDMIGRMRDTLVVQGTGTAPQWQPLLERMRQQHQLKLALKKEGPGPSDHASFYRKNIPVLFFFTNLHEDYHRVTDDAEKINAQGEQQILQLAAQIVTEVANQDSVLQFTKAESEQLPMRGARVSVGTIPDFAAETTGFRISGVRKGSPAEKAGLQGGDIIIKFGNFEIKNIYDYTYALGEFSAGEQVPVVIKRGEQTLTLVVTLERSQRP